MSINVKKHSQSHKKVIEAKNLTLMNDPVFQSNNTLKKYINEKLNNLESKNINVSKNKNTKDNKTVLKLNVQNKKNKFLKKNSSSEKYKLIKSNSKNSSSKKVIYTHSVNIKKNKNYKTLSSKNNSFIIINNNQDNIRRKSNYRRNSAYSSVDEHINMTQFGIDNGQRINSPPNKIKVLSKSKHKNISLNRSIVLDSKFNNNQHKNRKENEKENKSLPEKFKQEMNKNYNTIKLSQFNPFDNKYQHKKNNYPIHKTISNVGGKLLNEQTSERAKVFLNDIFCNNESLCEKECPLPMPYVKKYSSHEIQRDENINKENIPCNKDLHEPMEESKVPYPMANINKSNVFMNKKKKEIRIFVPKLINYNN